MRIVEVTGQSTVVRFLDVVNHIYKGDVAYIRPLNVFIEEIFDPEKNANFEHGDAVRFLLEDDNGKDIGRVAAFVNRKKAFGFAQPTGGMGFFESVNDQKAADLLFDAARDWLKDKGMQAMDGPINFGENDNFWGLLVDGFTPPGFGMQYNPSYYLTLFKNYGFGEYFEQVTNHLDLKKPFPERFWKIAAWIAKKKDYSFEHFKWREADRFLKDFKTIYDDAWRFHENFVPMDIASLEKTLRKGRLFIPEDFIWFAYHRNKPIGFIVVFLDLNQLIKGFDGKLGWVNRLKLFFHKKIKGVARGRVVILGVRPKYQKSGVESGLFWFLNGAVKKRSYLKELELSWVGDFNPKMRALQESLGATFGKKHITFRYVFDSSEQMQQRAASIPFDTKERVSGMNQPKVE